MGWVGIRGNGGVKCRNFCKESGGKEAIEGFEALEKGVRRRRTGKGTGLGK